MQAVILIIHLVLALAIIGLVLLQRSEGGGLGIGGGGGMGALAGAQSTATLLSKATAICAISFFCTSLLLGILAGTHTNKASIMDRLDQIPAQTAPVEAGKNAIDEDDIPKSPSAPVAD